MIDSTSSILMKVYRYDPGEDKKGYFQEFTVSSTEALTIMALLSKVHEIDPTFCCRTSTCFKGQCGSCLIRVNGTDVFGCTTLVKPGETVLVEPHSRFEIIRDVVVDFNQPLSALKG